MKYLIITCILVLIFTPSPSQTTVVWNTTKKGIFVGADSRWFRPVTSNGKLVDSIKGDDACKIVNVGKYTFALTGTYMELAKELAIEACNKGGDILKVGSLFRRNLSDTIASRYTNGKLKINPLLEPPFTTVTFFTFERDSAKILSLTTIFYFKNGNIYRDYRSSKKDVDATGHISAIESYLNHEYLDPNPVEGIKKLIKMQMEKNSAEVGGPIDLIQITKSGVTWVSKKKLCK